METHKRYGGERWRYLHDPPLSGRCALCLPNIDMQQKAEEFMYAVPLSYICFIRFTSCDEPGMR